MTFKKIRALVYEPGKYGRVEYITNDLETKQKLVGGYIEAVPLFLEQKGNRTLDIVCNEEGRLTELPFNRTIWNGRSSIMGTFLVMAANNKTGEFESLSESELDLVVNTLD
jgi:hypothetical protein